MKTAMARVGSCGLGLMPLASRCYRFCTFVVLIFCSVIASADSIHYFVCKDGHKLGLIIDSSVPGKKFMAQYCAYSVLDGHGLDERLRSACQNDRTDWAVKCFNDEFVSRCEDRDHVVDAKCLK